MARGLCGAKPLHQLLPAVSAHKPRATSLHPEISHLTFFSLPAEVSLHQNDTRPVGRNGKTEIKLAGSLPIMGINASAVDSFAVAARCVCDRCQTPLRSPQPWPPTGTPTTCSATRKGVEAAPRPGGALPSLAWRLRPRAATYMAPACGIQSLLALCSCRCGYLSVLLHWTLDYEAFLFF